jgi:hypothetical protein
MESSSSYEIDFTIHVHLYAGREPDSTTYTDYLILVLLVCILASYIVFNYKIILLTRRWPILRWINVPMLVAMSGFSIVHLLAIFLTESYFESITSRVREMSCTLVPFWMEYLIGMGGFSLTLLLRLLSLCMVLFPGCYTEDKSVRLLIQMLFSSGVLLPILVLCIYVSLTGDAEYKEDPYPHCTTPVGYKIGVVMWLLYVIAILVGMTVAIRHGVVAKMEVDVVVDVVKVSVAMLVLGCVLHFLYLLTFWWGRFAFLLMACILHTYAYHRYVFPVWVEYSVNGTEEARKASAERMAQMRGPVEFAIQDSLRITPKSLLTIVELRKSFFEYLRGCDGLYGNLITMRLVEQADLADCRDRDDYDSIHKILHFYDYLRELAEFRGVSEHTMIRNAKMTKLHNKLVDTHLVPMGTEYIHMDAGTRSALIAAIVSPDENHWDFEIFAKTAKRVAHLLCENRSAAYTSARFGDVLKIQEERSRQLKALSHLGLYEHAPASQTQAQTTDRVHESYDGIVTALVGCFASKEKTREEAEMEDLLENAVENIERFTTQMPDDNDEIHFRDGGCVEDPVAESKFVTVEL